MITAKFDLVIEGFYVPISVTEVMPPVPPVALPCVPIAPRQFLLSEIPPRELKKLCEKFEREVFKRANKESYLLSGRKTYTTEESELDLRLRSDRLDANGHVRQSK